MKRLIITVILTFALTAFAVHAVQTAFSGAGVIESTTGGFKFPDGSVQTSASSSSGACTPITYLPYLISNSGVYCLTGDLSTAITDGAAIGIGANNVTIDMNGWTLDGLAAGTGTVAHGIGAEDLDNIIIRNGTIQGFLAGIALVHVPDEITPIGEGHLVEDIHATTNRWFGIAIIGHASIARRNQVINTGGSTVYGGGIGLSLSGPGVRALDNDIYNTYATGTDEAIALSIGGAGAIAESNRITGVVGDTGATYGIRISNSDNVIARGNTVTSADFGIYFDGSTGKYMDNLTSNVTTPFTGGTAVGIND